jgi:formate hydrogenlyase transcriptional activator
LRIYAIDFPGSEGVLDVDVKPAHADARVVEVFETGQPALLHAADLAENPVAIALGIRSLCHLPLVSRERVLGVLSVGSLRDGAFSQEDVAFLGSVANQVALAVGNALAYGRIADLKDKLAQEKLYLEDEIRSELNFEEIVGKSEALRRVLKEVETVAPTDSTVLIYGETGTGKELIARAVHNLSARKSNAFVKLNCAAIPTGLLESELFGHEKGAFTGAIAQRIGRFELAHHGTVFLDEVGEIPLELQPKLLRVLQEREFERLGSGRTLRSDARLIAATNRDLAGMVEAREFRSDLYYRLNVFPIRVPALRERPEDIPLLVRHFAQQFSRRMGKHIDSIPAETMNALARYGWPGNIRELQNVIERAVILSSGPILDVPIDELHPVAGSVPPERGDVDMRSVLQETERQQMLSALEKANWKVAGPNGAAALLGMKRSTLQSRMQKLGIRNPA